MSGPLSGIDVIEFAGIGPVPFAGTMLAELGANVVRIERPGGLDSVLPAAQARAARGKTVVTLDLRGSRDDIDWLGSLILRSHVLIEGHRPGVMERLGFGPDECLASNPALVYGRMTGWGQDGPFSQRAGHDLNYISLTGALNAIGERDRAPAIPLNLLGDYGGGALYLVVGVLAALIEVRRGGQGQVVDAAIVDGVAHMLSVVHSALAAGSWVDERGSNWMDGGSPFYSLYRTSDDRYMAVTAVERPFYREFATRLGVDADLSMRDDPERHDELRDVIAARFRTATAAEWAVVFDGSDACVTPVLGFREAAAHPHVAARRTLVDDGDEIVAAAAPRFVKPTATDGYPR